MLQMQVFNPIDAFSFITKMFQEQAKILNATLSLQMGTSEYPLSDSSSESLPPDTFQGSPYLNEARTGAVPKKLQGDQIHLKQILINLLKTTLTFTTVKKIWIKVKYDHGDELLHV